MRITVNEDRDIELSDVYNPVVISTPAGRFGIAQRDGGIEVVKDGKLLFASYEQDRPEDDKNCPGCRGTGREPGYDADCLLCLKRRTRQAPSYPAFLRAMADLYARRPNAPSLPEYSQVDGLMAAAEMFEVGMGEIKERKARG